MGQDLMLRERPPSDQLHPGIYAAILGFVLLFVVSTFAFGDTDYADYLLAVVAGFFVIAMGIPFLLWLTWRHRAEEANQIDAGPLRDWSKRECETCQGRLKGWEAAIQVLLPIAAVAVGMTAIGTVLLLVEYHVV